MTSRWWKRGMALVLTVAMAAGLTACGGGGTDKTAEGEKHYFKATYLNDLPDSFNGNVSDVSFKGDLMYYGVYNEDYTEYSIYSYNIVSNEEQKLYTHASDNNGMGYSNVSSYSVTDEGEVYLMISRSIMDESSLTEDYSDATLEDVLEYMENQWGYPAEDAEQTWKDAYEADYTDEDGTIHYDNFLKAQNAQYISKNSIVKVDASGNEIYETELAAEGSENIGCNGMAMDKDGNLYLSINVWSDTEDRYYTDIYDKDGNKKGEVTSNDWTSGLITLADGSVAVIKMTDDGKYELTTIDPETAKEKQDGKITVPTSNNLTVLDEKNFLLTDGTSLYQYNTDTQKKTLYLSWMDCNISSSNVSSFSILTDGSLAACIQGWNSSGTTNEIALIKEVDASEVGSTKTLVLASLWGDSQIEEKIIDFNKSQDEYHITMKNFYSDDTEDYQDMVNNYTTAITTDPDIDIVLFNDYSEVLNFAGKGLNVDLYDLIDKDEVLSREDFLPNILSASEYDGKLAFLPMNFTLQTVVGKADDVGTEPGWTVSDMMDLLHSKPEGTMLFYGIDRASALNMCMNLGYSDFINWEDATCNFDSKEFTDILEFAATFPETFNWEENTDDTYVLMNQGKVLLDTYYMSDFEYMQVLRTVYGGDVTFIGYPTAKGNGALLSLNSIIGISKNCDDPDGAWQFLRTLYLPKDKDDDSYSYGFSIRKDEFEKYCKKAMKDDPNTGSTWSVGEFQVEIEPTTQAEVDQVKDLVYNTTAVSGAASSDITNIINEETEAYFSGQKTADEVAKIIQSRMQVYLSETK